MAPEVVREKLSLLTPEELAEALGIGIDTLARMRSRGEGPRVARPTKSPFYRLEDVREWLETLSWMPAGATASSSDKQLDLPLEPSEK